MKRLDIIKSIIDDSFLAEPSDSLIEENWDHKMKRISMHRDIFKSNDISYILYRFDPEEREIFPFFSNTSGLKRICDYILFAEEGKSCWCLLIEMKWGKDSPHAQLKASEAFVRYVIDAANRIGKSIFCEDIHFRRIGIPEFKKDKEGQQEAEVDYVDGYLQLTSRALRLASLLR